MGNHDEGARRDAGGAPLCCYALHCPFLLSSLLRILYGRQHRKHLAKVKRYNPQADVGLLRRAHDYAAEKHDGQMRRTGEPYIQHPIEVVNILADLEMDTPSLAAGFLHDVLEDCGVSRDELVHDFDEEIAGLVDAVTKLKLADFERRDPELHARAQALREAEAEAAKTNPKLKMRLEARNSADNLRKILLAMARDLRVMVIKLADRLHNMRTLNGLSPERQKKVARETLEIFAPLAHRLGIWQIKWLLEDLAFKYLYPDEYKDLTEKVARTRKAREKDIRDAIFFLKQKFEQAGLDAEIQGRPKHLWSIRNKMRKEEIDFNDIYDLIAIRVITNTMPDCYSALGLVHDLWLPIPGKFDDYIAKRKSNLYQSLHTKVYGPRGEPLEVQIRTWEMHRVAEYGVAAHWTYKEKGEQAKAGADFDRKMAFLRQQLFDWQQDNKDSNDFLRNVVSDLFTDQAFVFTPKGDVIDLPAGATPVDFAYRIHTEMGEHTAAAKVNGRIVPLDYTFKNGDICAIVSRPNANPSLDWLKFVKTSHARSKIKNYFRKQRYAENMARGREMLADEFSRLNLPHDVLRDNKQLLAVAQALNKETVEDLYAALGFGDVALGVVVNRLRALLPEPAQGDENDYKIGRRTAPGANNAKLAIAPGGVDDVAISRAKCCLPLPGDSVVGYVSRGKGMLLHRDGCPNVQAWREREPERLVEVDWQPDENSKWETGVVIETVDRVGLLRDVTEIFSENRTFILGINTRSNTQNRTAVLRIDFQASCVDYVDRLIRKLHALDDLFVIHRLGVGAEEPKQPSLTP
jgi:GTP pyrophosphokinase